MNRSRMFVILAVVSEEHLVYFLWEFLHYFRNSFCWFYVLKQNFVVRNDVACGSTIGPILASGIGIRTVDVGAPQLSMHSIREMCGVDDVGYSYNHFKAFFEDFSALDAQLAVDEP